MEKPEEDKMNATLRRMLNTPPKPKPKKDASASPKKRVRPAKDKNAS